jgi:hypothetical protein
VKLAPLGPDRKAEPRPFGAGTRYHLGNTEFYRQGPGSLPEPAGPNNLPENTGNSPASSVGTLRLVAVSKV